jgi:hypothetical protein
MLAALSIHTLLEQSAVVFSFVTKKKVLIGKDEFYLRVIAQFHSYYGYKNV